MVPSISDDMGHNWIITRSLNAPTVRAVFFRFSSNRVYFFCMCVHSCFPVRRGGHLFHNNARGNEKKHGVGEKSWCLIRCPVVCYPLLLLFISFLLLRSTLISSPFCYQLYSYQGVIIDLGDSLLCSSYTNTGLPHFCSCSLVLISLCICTLEFLFT